MQGGDRSAGRERIEDIVNYVMGFSVVMKGVAKLDEAAHHPLAVALLFAAGLFILSGTFFRRPLERRVRDYFELFHVAEGLALWVVGLLVRAHSQLVWALFLFAGTLFLVIGLMHGFTRGPSGQRVGLLMRRGIGAAFLVAATLLVFLSAGSGLRSAPRVTALLFAVIGAVLLVLRSPAPGAPAPAEISHVAAPPPDATPPA